MSKGRRTASGDEAFTRPIWDTIGDLEADYKVEVSIRFEPSDQRGVFRLTVAATEMDTDGLYHVTELNSIDYPNSGTMSFFAQLFAQINKLAVQLADRPIRYRPTTEGERRASSLADN